jgi:light-regulated signal transduction histidine kinase (bacteriophytochrome)
MRGSIGRMANLIDDLLRFARFAREPLHCGVVPVAVLVQQCLSELQGEIEARGIEVQVGALPDCRADINLLRQVWANLLGNAVKYTRRQSAPRIVIEARQSDERVVYCVRDNGAGFDMAQADRLFNVFQRLHRPDEFEGTGVGLATAARIVERHGGRIWADSAPQRGATFYFHLGDPAAP